MGIRTVYMQGRKPDSNVISSGQWWTNRKVELQHSIHLRPGAPTVHPIWPDVGTLSAILWFLETLVEMNHSFISFRNVFTSSHSSPRTPLPFSFPLPLPLVIWWQVNRSRGKYEVTLDQEKWIYSSLACRTRTRPSSRPWLHVTLQLQQNNILWWQC